MSTLTFRFTGWKAVALIVALVAFAAFRATRARSAMDGQGREVLESWIVGELQRPILADSTLTLAEKGEAVLRASSVTLRTLDAHGPLSDAVVRVELEPNPAFPPDFELVRYYRMQYSSLTGWSHKGPGSALTFWLAFI